VFGEHRPVNGNDTDRFNAKSGLGKCDRRMVKVKEAGQGHVRLEGGAVDVGQYSKQTKENAKREHG
jgi:hypothetical protein